MTDRPTPRTEPWTTSDGIRLEPTPQTEAFPQPERAREELRRYFWRCLDDPDAVPEDTELDRLMLAIEAQARTEALDVDALRDAIYAVSVAHDWENTTDREDRTQEIAARYAAVLAAKADR